MREKIAETTFDGICSGLSQIQIADQILELPVKGLKVESIIESKMWIDGNWTDEKVPTERPLTVGETLEMFEGLFEIAKKVCSVGCMRITCTGCWVEKALTTKDGGRIVKEE